MYQNPFNCENISLVIIKNSVFVVSKYVTNTNQLSHKILQNAYQIWLHFILGITKFQQQLAFIPCSIVKNLVQLIYHETS